MTHDQKSGGKGRIGGVAFARAHEGGVPRKSARRLNFRVVARTVFKIRSPFGCWSLQLGSGRAGGYCDNRPGVGGVAR